MSKLALELIQKEKKERTGKLDMGNCGLTRIPEEIFELHWLKELSLCNEYFDIKQQKWIWSTNNGIPNKITEEHLQSDFANFQKLEILRIGGGIRENWQFDDFRIFWKLISLRSLDLSSNKISDIGFLSGLTNLTYLDLSDNKISDIGFLSGLTNLTYLDLSSNQISDIGFLSGLTNLTNLVLSDNKISDIEILIPLLKNGVSINLDEYGGGGVSLYKNPITNPPMNIVEQGADAILDWFAQIDESGAEPFYESKLMILGQGGAGKTTFVNLLLDPNYKVEPGKLDSTIGVVVKKGREFAHLYKEGVSIKAHLWDFGGQNIQKMLHQFFITEECLYVLVSDKRAENTNFDYWFQIINLLGPKSSVIVLENPKEAKHSNENFALNKYRELYPELKIDTIEVNLNHTRGKHKKRWESLLEMISERLSEIELVNRMVPKKWGLVRQSLKELETERKIKKDKYYQLCENPAIGLNKRQADWCLNYFRSLGDLIYFDDRDLCTHIFLDHNWLTHGMYYILSDRRIEDNGGRFTREQAFEKWQSFKYLEEEKVMLINLLLKDKFDICYELPDEKDVFITPLLLPTDKPKSKWDHETNLRFRYQYGFIPHGLFSRLIVQLHEKIDGEQHWKTGVRLVNTIHGNQVYAEVQQYNDPEENQQIIDIKISGEKVGCKQMLSFIRSAVEKLHNDFRNIQVKQVVACNCENCTERLRKGEKPSFFDFDKLQKKVLNKSYFEECENSNYKGINIGQVLNDIIIENAAVENKESQFLKQLKDMGMSINQIIQTNNNSNQATATSTANASAEAKTEVTITINYFLGEVQNLKEDFEEQKKRLLSGLSENDFNDTLNDIQKAEKAVEVIENAQKQSKELPAKEKSRLKSFIDDLSDENSTLHKGLKLMRKGRDYGVKLAELYNQVAANTGMPSIPPLALEVIKKI